jgi:hypothetical protein|tara:strand:- start:1378 stop:1653 length:276 start_codon:yes stop_codon:yes gene_type:complete
MDLMKKYLSRVKPGSREKELKVNMKEVINTLQVKEPVYTFEEVKKLEGVSVEGLAAIQKIKKAFSGYIVDIEDTNNIKDNPVKEEQCKKDY